MLAPADARLHLVKGEDFFMDTLAKRFNASSDSSSSHEQTLPQGDAHDPLFTLQQAHVAQRRAQRSSAEQAAEVRAKNRAAQRKSRARKKACTPCNPQLAMPAHTRGPFTADLQPGLTDNTVVHGLVPAVACF